MTTTTHTPSPATCGCAGCRPEPSKISFAAECFVPSAEVVEFYVLRSALHPGPARFDSREAAEAYARRLGRSVREHRYTAKKRVRWC